jgi:hypothetical protein
MGEGSHPVFLLKDIPHQDVKRILGMPQSLPSRHANIFYF